MSSFRKLSPEVPSYITQISWERAAPSPETKPQEIYVERNIRDDIVATAAHIHLTDCKDYCPTSLYTPATITSRASPVNSHDHSPYLQTVLHLPKPDSIPYLLCSHCKASPVLLSSQSLHHLALTKWNIISRYPNPHYFPAMVAFSLLAYIQVEEVGLVNCSPPNHLPTHTCL